MTGSQIGFAQIPTAVDPGPAQGPARARLFLFVAISLLVHLWAMTSLCWPSMPSGAPTHSTPLTVRIIGRLAPQTSPATKVREGVSFDEPEPSGESQPAPAISQDSGSASSVQVSGSLPPGVGERPEETFRRRASRRVDPPATAEGRRAVGTSAREIIEQAKASIPEIAKQTEPSVIGPAQVFDPKFRRRLKWARREKVRQDELTRQTAQRPLSEVLGEYGDYVKVRIGEKCWQMPVEEDSGALQVRIPMWVPRCGGPEPLRFDIRSSYSELFR